MKYVIVMPAYNEEAFIGQALSSVAGQELLPQQLIVVNDGSSDRTGEIIESFARQYPWIKQVVNEKKEKRAPGSKVIRAFYLGFREIEAEYEFVVKLDADLSLPPAYFQTIADMFACNPKLGMAGGSLLVEQNGSWKYEHYADRDHIKGAFKAYRRACFEQIGGPRVSIGWDTLDELLAFYHGWEVEVNLSLQLKHHRALGTETGSLKIRKKAGVGMYRMRYGLWITLISAAKSGYLNRPYGLTGLWVFWGWLSALLRGDEFIVSPEEGAFIRAYRWHRMVGKLKGKPVSFNPGQ
jgi:glycosyltransferase involved in cell wall biosynthesis